MRSKVVINLSTDDPLEAEILDMLTEIKSSHRKQERLRSLLKGGYNLFYKNMSADRAMTEAFDKQDVALILSLFGKGGTRSGLPEAISEPSVAVSDKSEVRVHDPVVSRENANDVKRSAVQKESVDSNVIKESPSKYQEISPQIDDEKPAFLEFDPSLMQLEQVDDEHDFVDPLARLLSK